MTWAVFHAYQHMLHHWHAQIRRLTRSSNHAVRRLPVFWVKRVSKLKTTVYQLHGQLTVFSLLPPQVPQWSGQTVHCFRPLRVSRLTHIHTTDLHTLVLPAQRSSIPRCQFRYLRPLVPSITFRLWFTLYCFCPVLFLPFSLFIPTMILPSAATDASTERHVVVRLYSNCSMSDHKR